MAASDTGTPRSFLLSSDDPNVAAAEALMDKLARGGRNDVLGPLVSEHLATGGKRLRARLALAATAALGRPPSEAIAWAAACELGHNATLVHDDLQDGDTLRRGKPTTWIVHGMAQAVNTGDLMLMLPILAIGDVPVSAAVRADLAGVFAERMAAVVRGQADEYDMTQAGVTDRDRYNRAVAGKTGALFRLPVEGAALIAGCSRSAACRVSEPFQILGTVFQIQDDILDLYGDKGRDSRGSDLREGKVSALVVAHLDRHPEDRDWLLELLRLPRDETPAQRVDDAIERFRSRGALEDTLSTIQALSEEARSAVAQRHGGALCGLMSDLLGAILKPIEPVMAL